MNSTPLAVLPTILLALALQAPVAADSAADRALVERLVRDLGSPSWEARERATERLAALGQPVQALLAGALRSPDLEVRRRAQQVCDRVRPPVLLREKVDVSQRMIEFAEGQVILIERHGGGREVLRPLPGRLEWQPARGGGRELRLELRTGELRKLPIPEQKQK